ncbi:MAG: NapC/NirT family cytochrome c [Planctomycetes bacterium]|nr:NapC/NirT family cytochrome c [Planctomycetota bacterium]
MRILTTLIRAFWSFVALVSSNFLSLIGSTLTTGCGIGFLAFLATDLYHPFQQPYVGILGYLVLPSIFVAGLALIPLGLWLRRRRRAVEPNLFQTGSGYPRIDFGDPAHRRRFMTFLVLTMGNLVLLGAMSYHGVEYMDSQEFCGQVCHSVMKPEWTAYQGSPHSRTRCVECHMGPGADMFVRYKLSGLRQVWRVNAGGYSRPIHSPVRNLRPARDTCEQCHWPEKFHGDRLWTRAKFQKDEGNTRLTTALLMKVGGGAANGGKGAGIHWHVNDANQITYVSTDDKRMEIPWVEVKRPGGGVEVFVSEDVPAAKAGAEALLAGGHGERRMLDCLDCHNRPTHTFLMPERALDRAMAEGRIDLSLPCVKDIGIDALKKEYANATEAEAGILRETEAYYAESYPEVAGAQAEAIRAAAREFAQLWKRNVFPEMGITWGTYPNHLGHDDFPGCFRCHDDRHRSKSGKTISQDCGLCHTIVASEEPNLDVDQLVPKKK